MEAKEFGTVMSALKAAYPNANIVPDKRSTELWWAMLMDLDYAVCLNAVKQLISTNKFCPTIAEIRECYARTASPELPDWGNGWGEVQRAIHNYGYCREEEALESMSEQTRRCVKRMGWQNICMSENPSADRANFRMIYERESNSKMAMLQLPGAVREQRMKFQQLAAGVVERLEEKPKAEIPQEPEVYAECDGITAELKRRWETSEGGDYDTPDR